VNGIFEFYSENEHVNYPFEDSPDSGLKSLFVDAAIYTTSWTQKRIKLVLWNPPQITLQYEDGSAFFSAPGTGIVFSGPNNFGNYSLYEWKKVDTNLSEFTGAEVVVRFVLRTDQISLYSLPIIPTMSVLLSSLVNPRPLRVRKLALKQPGLPLPLGGGFAQGIVQLEAGYNMSLQTAPPAATIALGLTPVQEVRKPTTVIVDAIPGAGLGVYKDCSTPSPDIKILGNATPDANGNVELQGKDCTWTEVPITNTGPAIHPHTNYHASPVPNTLQLRDECTACCDCSDYKKAYEGIRTVWQRALHASHRIETLREQYQELVQDVKAALVNVCPGEITSDLGLVARPDYHLAVHLSMVSNESTLTTAPLTIYFLFRPYGPVFTNGSGLFSNQDVRLQPMEPDYVGSVAAPFSGPAWKITIPPIPPQGRTYYDFAVRFPSTTGAAVAWVAAVTYHDILGRALPPGQAFWIIRSSQLLPPLRKN